MNPKIAPAHFLKRVAKAQKMEGELRGWWTPCFEETETQDKADQDVLHSQGRVSKRKVHRENPRVIRGFPSNLLLTTDKYICVKKLCEAVGGTGEREEISLEITPESLRRP